jgi:hypothetical protein
VAGLGVLALAGWLILGPLYQAAQWQGSPEAARAARNAAAPTPIWIVATPTVTAAMAGGSQRNVPPPATSVLPVLAANPPSTPGVPPAAVEQSPTSVPAADTPVIVQPTATPTLAPSDLKLTAAAFEFEDPPQPGAHARLSLTVHNPTDQAAGAINLALPTTWLNGYQIESTDPPVVDGTQDKTAAHLNFAGPDPESDVDVSVDVVTTDEVIDSPALVVTDADGREVGRAQPPTQAPPPDPGPVYSIDIPRLDLRSGVVPVDWDPPLFVVGQVRTSAFVTLGNSVLVGHVRGAAGYNIFDHLDELHPGDAVIANSRGKDYDFVVTQTEVLPGDDASPTDPSLSPRLTLMTCTGDWNPLEQAYTDRLWIIAEPLNAAKATPTPIPAPPDRISSPGGLGNLDNDLVTAFGAPTGQSPRGLAVYQHAGEHRADITSGRATLVAAVAPTSAPWTLDTAKRMSVGMLPKDAQPRGNGPEGNAQFVVEHYSSADAARVFPDSTSPPGDLVVVYKRKPDGHISYVAVALGDDPNAAMAKLSDLP